MTIDIVSARRGLAETVNRVLYQGERVVLERHGKGVAALVSMEDLALLEKLEDDVDAKAVRAAMREAGEIPWEQVKADLGLRGLGKGGTAAVAKSRRPAKAKAKV